MAPFNTTRCLKRHTLVQIRRRGKVLVRSLVVAIVLLQCCMWIRVPKRSVSHPPAGLEFRRNNDEPSLSASSSSGHPGATSTKPTLPLPKLGVLLDTGRHEFRLEWVFALLDSMARLGLSILHVRLSDDQRLVDPTIASSSAYHYWKPIVQYARDRSVQIVPELNVPSHALAWGELAVSCPKVICRTAFGIPLNVSHPNLWDKVDMLLQWIMDTFDEPELLHLGGDEIHTNGDQCIEEATGTTTSTQDYEGFERSLGALLQSKYRIGPERCVYHRDNMPLETYRSILIFG
jgi:Glycosyl hydrolase family 20, catalytic domain